MSSLIYAALLNHPTDFASALRKIPQVRFATTAKRANAITKTGGHDLRLYGSDRPDGQQNSAGKRLSLDVEASARFVEACLLSKAARVSPETLVTKASVYVEEYVGARASAYLQKSFVNARLVGPSTNVLYLTACCALAPVVKSARDALSFVSTSDLWLFKAFASQWTPLCLGVEGDHQEHVLRILDRAPLASPIADHVSDKKEKR